MLTEQEFPANFTRLNEVIELVLRGQLRRTTLTFTHWHDAHVSGTPDRVHIDITRVTHEERDDAS